MRDLRVLALPLLLVTSLVAAAHWPVLGAQARAFDDNLFVTDNNLVRQPGWSSVGRFFGEVLEPSSVGGYYLPLTMTSLMIDVAMGGRREDLTAFHRTHLALHLGCVLLIAGILYTLFGSAWAASLVALLFGLHPLTVEPVAWVSERKTLLATFFSFGSILCYLRAPKGWSGWKTASLGAFALALLSKPTITPLPLIHVALDFWPRGRRGWRVLLDQWPWFVLAALSTAITILSQIRTAPLEMMPETGVVRPVLQIAWSLAFYARKLVWPVDLSCAYIPPADYHLGDPGLVTKLVIAAAALVAVGLLARRAPALATGTLVFLIALSPTFLILKWSRMFVYDRYLYFPALGIALVLGAWAARLWSQPSPGGTRRSRVRLRRALAVAVVVALAAAEFVGTRRALARWKDSVSLWSNAVSVSPGSLDARNFLAAALEERGDLDAAASELRAALALDPNYIFAVLNLAKLEAGRRHHDDAAAAFRHAVQLSPGDPNIFYEWGVSEKSAGRLEEAEGLLGQALSLDSLHVRALGQLGTVQVMRGRPEVGVATLRRAVAAAPADPLPHFALALVLLNLKGPDVEAVEHLVRAAELGPNWPTPLGALAWLRATSPDPAFRDGPAALELVTRAARLGPPTPPLLDTHAAALAAVGQFREAAAMSRRAETMAMQQGQAGLAREFAFRAATYERGVAYVDTTLRSPSSAVRPRH